MALELTAQLPVGSVHVSQMVGIEQSSAARLNSGVRLHLDFNAGSRQEND
jgi:hypothetical protein